LASQFYQRCGRGEQAAEAFGRAVALRPDSIALLEGRAVALCACGKLDEALSDLERAVALAADRPVDCARLLSLRAATRARRCGAKEPAADERADLERAAQLLAGVAPSPESSLLRAAAMLRLGQWEAAAADATLVIDAPRSGAAERSVALSHRAHALCRLER
jgi:tetratricopeptide (TPR) repeat protein